jgi:hypothetical protein
MNITKGRLKQIILEELQGIEAQQNRLDEIPTYIKNIARRRGIPHMGSAPGPRRGGDLDSDAPTDDEEAMQDFWMNELNSALLSSMSDAGVGNTMMPSAFLKALLPVLEAYGVGAEAQEMVDHVQSNQDIYSPMPPKQK